MAAFMQSERVKSLLDEAARTGCPIVWIRGSALYAGSTTGEARFLVDFEHGCLTEIATDGDGSSIAAAVRQPPSKASPDSTRGDRPPDLHEPVLAGAPGRRTGSYSLILDGRVIPAISCQALLLAGLQSIESMRPGTLEKLAEDKGRTKKVVARDRDRLYGREKLARYAKQIDGGWWVATNNNREEVAKFIRRAAFHAGLDVEIRF